MNTFFIKALAFVWAVHLLFFGWAFYVWLSMGDCSWSWFTPLRWHDHCRHQMGSMLFMCMFSLLFNCLIAFHFDREIKK